MAERGEVRAFIEAWRLSVMRDRDLAPSAKVNAIVISSCANIEAAEIRDNELVAAIYPGIDWIADKSGHKRRTAAQGVADLRESGRLRSRRRSQNSNFYSLILLPDVRDTAHQATPDMQYIAHRNKQQAACQTSPDVQGLAYQAEPDVQNEAVRCANSRNPTCEDSHTNLVLNPEDNLFRDLWREIGESRWHSHIWNGATIDPPKTILFRSRKHLEFALKHYRDDFERLGYLATTRSAA